MSASQPSNHSARRKQEAQSVDLVQRVVVSALVAVVFGTFAAVLAAYLAIAGERDLPPTSVIGLWIMTGVMGLGTAAAILLINRRAPTARGSFSASSPWRYRLHGFLADPSVTGRDLLLTARRN
jgi:hypothetical protein